MQTIANVIEKHQDRKKSVEYIINVNLLVSPFMVSGRGIYCPPHFYFCIEAVQRKVDRTGTIMSRHHFVVLEVDLKVWLSFHS